MQATLPAGRSDAVVPYRADIDGLRAIAVLAVIGYHAFPGRVPGGFSGVDVFFVVSGYLIAGDIARRIDAGAFSLAAFYARRVRRLFPALLAVLVACLLVGALVLLPDELKQLLAHAAASAAFVENFRLLAEAGYFDTGSATKPLLHIWSLAIEEQFYLLCPLLLLAVRGPRLRFGLAVAMAVVSFAVNVVVSRGDAAAAYYLPHTRFWEILIGVAIALAPTAGVGTATWRQRESRSATASGEGDARSSFVADAAALAGIALLALGMALIDRDRRYPGWWGLLPTLGTALLVVAGPQTALARLVLARPGLRLIGLISYPLYLWHWPALVFLRIVDTPNPSSAHKAIAIALSAGLAVLTWRYLEQPVRQRGVPRAVPRLALGMGALGVLAALASLPAVTLPRAPGLSAAEDGRRRDLNFTLHLPRQPPCDVALRAAAASPTQCLQARPGAPDAVLLGDSHAYALFYGLADVDRGRNWLVLASSSCPPLLGVHVRVAGRDCLPGTEAAVRAVVADSRIATVVLAFLGGYVNPSGPPPGDDRGQALLAETVELTEDGTPGATNADLVARGLERTVAALAAAGKRIVIYIDVPELPFSPRDCVDRPLAKRRVAACELQRSDVLHHQTTLRAVVARVLESRPLVQPYDPLPVLCDATACRIERGDLLLYRDQHHLSVRGSRLLAEPFVAWLDGRPPPR
jgi:peptidoglycan/LPS O-acetylase OafA/YrhL